MTKRLALPAVFLLLSAAPLYAGEAEDAAVKAVEKLGGAVTRDDQDPAHPVVAVEFVASPIRALFERARDVARRVNR